MKNLKFMAVAMATALVFVACNNNNENQGGNEPSIKSNVPEVAATEGAYTVVWNAVDYSECNGLVFAGNYNDWSTDPSNMAVFEKIDGYTNWYKAVITPAAEITQLEGKPCALAADGTFPSSWNYQWTGSEEHPCEVLKGEVSFIVEYSTETKMIVPQIGTVVYVRSYGFKEDPCVVNPVYDVTFNLTVQYALHDSVTVYVVGDFAEKSWTLDAYPMERVDATHFKTTVKSAIGKEYKYTAQAQWGSWDFEMVPAAPEEGKDCSEKLEGNLKVADVTVNDVVYGFAGINATICKAEAVAGVLYIKCDAEGWTWKQMTKAEDKEVYTFETTLLESSLKTIGANINTVADDNGASWFALEDVDKTTFAAGDKVIYTYDATVDPATLTIAKAQ